MFRSAAAITATATVMLIAGLGGAAAYGDSGSEASAEPAASSTTTPATADAPATTLAPPTTLPTTTLPPTTTTLAPTTTTSVPEPDCSAAALDLDRLPPQPGLPPEVAATRDAIVAAAVACDWERLDALTAGEFAYSYGIGRRPISYWQEREYHGEPATAQMVLALSLSYGMDDQFDQPVYYWPAALGTPPGSPEWSELAGLYTDDELARMADFGGFTGHHHGIRADGDWRYYIFGNRT